MVEKKDTDGLLGSFMQGTHALGQLWRRRAKPALIEARERLGQAGQLLGDARDAVQAQAGRVRVLWDTFTPEGRDLKEQLLALPHALQSGVGVITGLRGITSITAGLLTGMPPKLGLALLALHRLETAAEAKNALDIRQLVKAKAYFDDLREKVCREGDAELDEGVVALKELIETARASIDLVPSTAGELRRLFIAVSSKIDQLGREVIEYASASDEFATKFGVEAIDNPLDPLLAARLKDRLTTITPAVRAQELAAALELADLGQESSRTLTLYIDTVENFGRLLQRLRDLEGFMTTQVTEAETANVQNDDELLAAGRGFMTATRTKPIDLDAAERCKDAYVARLEQIFGIG